MRQTRLPSTAFTEGIKKTGMRAQPGGAGRGRLTGSICPFWRPTRALAALAARSCGGSALVCSGRCAGASAAGFPREPAGRAAALPQAGPIPSPHAVSGPPASTSAALSGISAHSTDIALSPAEERIRAPRRRAAHARRAPTRTCSQALACDSPACPLLRYDPQRTARREMTRTRTGKWRPCKRLCATRRRASSG